MTIFECPSCGAKFHTKQQLYVLGKAPAKTKRIRSKGSPELEAAFKILLPKPKRGRPPIVGPRPWEQEGMSRRTWYRRKKESKA